MTYTFGQYSTTWIQVGNLLGEYKVKSFCFNNIYNDLNY